LMDFPLPLPEPCRVFGKRKLEAAASAGEMVAVAGFDDVSG
jgi:hypothetical protein